MGCACRIDANAIGRYCEMWSRYRAAADHLQKYGETYPVKDKSGNVKTFKEWPQVKIVHVLSSVLTKLEAEFGMTPSARSRIVVAPSSQPKNTILDFLNTG